MIDEIELERTTRINKAVREVILSLRYQGIEDWEILDAWSNLFSQVEEKGKTSHLILQEASERLAFET